MGMHKHQLWMLTHPVVVMTATLGLLLAGNYGMLLGLLRYNLSQPMGDQLFYGVLCLGAALVGAALAIETWALGRLRSKAGLAILRLLAFLPWMLVVVLVASGVLVAVVAACSGASDDEGWGYILWSLLILVPLHGCGIAGASAVGCLVGWVVAACARDAVIRRHDFTLSERDSATRS